MALEVWCEIVCSRCSYTCAGRFTTKAIPRREMIKEAKNDGWVIVSDSYQFCSQQCKDNVK